MEENYYESYKVYIKTDENGNIIAVNSSAFLADTEGWTEIDEGGGDKYHHAQNNYFDKPLADERGLYNYKLADGVVTERTSRDKASDIKRISAKMEISEFKCKLAATDYVAAKIGSFLMGAAAQLGIFLAFFGALCIGFTPAEAGSIGIIGGADGPTAIFTTTQLAPHLLGSIAVAAYSYMALVPIIQPPIMKALTTKEERMIKMEQLRPVSKIEKLIFPVLVTMVVSFLVPDTTPLIGMLMLGNLFKESGVTDRLSKTAQNELMNIVTIFLGVTVGATANAASFLNLKTLGIVAMGLCAFACGTAGGVLLGKLMCVLSGGKINPLIGSAGVSAVPMAARVSQKVGQAENPTNFLLMHAMGPNVAGVIGSAVAAGVLLAVLK